MLGGTGSFGRALAARLVADGDDSVVIGSRDADRAAETARELGGRATGATNDDAVRDVDLVVLAVKAEGALDTARAVARALGSTPLLSVASAIAVRKDVGAIPDPDARSLAERIQDVVGASRRRRPAFDLRRVARRGSARRGRARLRRRPAAKELALAVACTARRRSRARRRSARGARARSKG